MIAAIVPAVTLALGSSATPTPAQIHQRVNRAESSRDLWATVNICSTGNGLGSLGVRGQIPALGFNASLAMGIAVQYWNSPKRQWASVPAAARLLQLGSYVTGLHQAGYTFKFASPALLRAVVAFQWRLGSTVIGRATRLTDGGINHVDFGDPPGYSRATCTIS